MLFRSHPVVRQTHAYRTRVVSLGQEDRLSAGEGAAGAVLVAVGIYGGAARGEERGRVWRAGEEEEVRGVSLDGEPARFI